MFYLIIAILILVYYIFGAPKNIKSTINIIAVVGFCAFLVVLSLLSFTKLAQSPPEIFIGFAMTILAYFTILDIVKLTKKEKDK